MQCPECQQLRHHGECEPQPTELDLLEAAKNDALMSWILLIKAGASEAAKAEARIAALEARDRFYDAGGK